MWFDVILMTRIMKKNSYVHQHEIFIFLILMTALFTISSKWIIMTLHISPKEIKRKELWSFFAVLSLKHQSSSVWPKVNQKVFSSTSPPFLIINEENNIKYDKDGVFWGRGIFANGERRRIRRCQPQGAFKWSPYFSFTLTLPLSCRFFLSESFSVSLTKDTAASKVLFLLHHCQ